MHLACPSGLCLATWSHGVKATATAVSKAEKPLCLHCLGPTGSLVAGEGPVTLSERGGRQSREVDFDQQEAGAGKETRETLLALPLLQQTLPKCGGSMWHRWRQPGCLSNQLCWLQSCGQPSNTAASLLSSMPASLPSPRTLTSPLLHSLRRYLHRGVLRLLRNAPQ